MSLQRWIFISCALVLSQNGCVTGSGKGTLHAFTIVQNQRQPGFAEEVPYVVAMVELDEGVRMMTNLIGVEADPEHVKIGMPVEVVYEDVSDEITLPKFKPAG